MTVSFLALLNSLVPFYFNQYDELGYYCWISQPAHGKGHTTGFAMRLSLRYCQCLIVCVINCLIYIKLYNHISKLELEIKANTTIPDSSNNTNRAKETIRKFIFYPSKLHTCLIIFVTFLNGIFFMQWLWLFA